MPKLQVMWDNGTKPLSIKFTNTTDDMSKYVKGYFIVRQERIPTIYAQGFSINKTKDKYGNIPVLRGDSGNVTQSFLDKSRNLTTGEFVTTPLIENKAAIVPEAVVRQPIFSQLFTSSEFKVSYVNKPIADTNLDSLGAHYYPITLIDTFDLTNTVDSVTLTLVNDNTKLTSNGTDYFSTIAGDATQA